MTIQERLRRSNFIMLVVPVLIAGMLLLIGLGVALLLALEGLKHAMANKEGAVQ